MMLNYRNWWWEIVWVVHSTAISDRLLESHVVVWTTDPH